MKKFCASLVFLFLLLAAPQVALGLTPLKDSELANCSAGSGISLELYITSTINVSSSFYQDTDTGNRIEFKNIVWDDGSGGAFTYEMLADIDIGTNDAGKTILKIKNFPHPYARSLSSSLTFCNQDLGSIKVSDIVKTENTVLIGTHGGLDFEYNEKIDIGYARYQYNTTLGDNPLTTSAVETDYPINALKLSGIHFSAIANGAAEYPTTWTYSGAFKIGDMTGENPAQIDVGTNTDGVTAIKLEVPMTGSIRVENVTFGANDFGPLVLDGLNVHRLSIQFHP